MTFFFGGFPYPHITRALKHRVKTRLISIDSQPKKFFVVVVVVISVVVVVVHVFVVVIPVVDTRNIPLKFGWNQVINRWDVVDVVVVSVLFLWLMFLLLLLLLILETYL